MACQPLLLPEINYRALPVVAWRQWVEDRDGTFEHRKRMIGVEPCEKCGGRVEFWQDTEQWTEAGPGRWQHDGWGLSYGFCESCPTAYHDGFDCMYVIDLDKASA